MSKKTTKESYLVTVSFTVEKVVRIEAGSEEEAEELAKVGAGTQEDYSEGDYEVLNTEED